MTKRITAEQLDALVDSGEDISGFIDMASVSQPNKATKKVNVDMPLWMIDGLDREADRLAVPRQAIIKIMLDEGLTRGQARQGDGLPV